MSELNQSPLHVSNEHLDAFVMTEYDATLDQGIAELMPQLDPGFSGQPQPGRLEKIVASPFHDQLVAVRKNDQKVISTATMTEVLGYGLGQAGRLEDFVSDSEARGTGAGSATWNLMMKWCRSRNLAEMVFESEADRPRALKFYANRGAKLQTDSLQVPGFHFKVEVPAASENEEV